MSSSSLCLELTDLGEATLDVRFVTAQIVEGLATKEDACNELPAQGSGLGVENPESRVSFVCRPSGAWESEGCAWMPPSLGSCCAFSQEPQWQMGAGFKLLLEGLSCGQSQALQCPERALQDYGGGGAS